MIDFDSTANAAVNEAFGEPLIYTVKSTGASKAFFGPFQEPYRVQELTDDGSVKWTTIAPSCGARRVDLPAAPVQGDTVLRKRTGERFLVANPVPDGMGWVRLIFKVLA